jgi:hypothetical protein
VGIGPLRGASLPSSCSIEWRTAKVAASYRRGAGPACPVPGASRVRAAAQAMETARAQAAATLQAEMQARLPAARCLEQCEGSSAVLRGGRSSDVQRPCPCLCLCGVRAASAWPVEAHRCRVLTCRMAAGLPECTMESVWRQPRGVLQHRRTLRCTPESTLHDALVPRPLRRRT